MDQVTFLIAETLDGGFTAHGLEASIFTEADSADEIGEAVRDAVRCHFAEGEAPGLIRLRWVREELLPVVPTLATVLTCVVEYDGPGYVSLCPQLDVASRGETEDKARANLAEALACFLGAADEDEIGQRLDARKKAERPKD